jgi:hypothetical protein
VATTTYRSTITADGRLKWDGASYTPDDGAEDADTTNHLECYWDINSGTYRTDQAFFGYDLTSPTTGDAITAGATINSATFNLYLYEHGSIARTVDIYAYDWGTTLTTADWRTVAQMQTLYDGGDGLVASYNIPAGWGGAEGAHDFTEGAAAAAAISAAIGGTLRLMLVIAAYRAGTTPTSRGYAGFYSASNATESNRPLLTVDWTAAAGGTSFLPHIMRHHFIPPLIGGH